MRSNQSLTSSKNHAVVSSSRGSRSQAINSRMALDMDFEKILHAGATYSEKGSITYGIQNIYIKVKYSQDQRSSI